MTSKVNVTLHGANGTHQATLEPKGNFPTPQPTEPDDTNSRKSAFATMRELEQQFSDAGISTEQVWAYLKSENAVQTRSKLTSLQWAKVAAQLQSARRDPAMFKIFVDGIPDTHFRIHVYASEPSVCIGRPRDIEKHHIADEWGDFQQIATDNQCEIKVTQGKRTTYYKPLEAAVMTPEPVQVSKAAVKPVVSGRTNARGEVLSAWGTVLEVQHA